MFPLNSSAPPAHRAHPAITHCDNCGCDWLDNGLNPVSCPYCTIRELLAERDRLAAENARLREALEFARKKLALMAIEGEVTRRIIRAALKEDGWRER